MYEKATIENDNQHLSANKHEVKLQENAYTVCLEMYADVLNDGVSGTGAARFIGDILQPISTTMMVHRV